MATRRKVQPPPPKPRHKRLVAYLWGMFKRNPIAFVASLVAIFVGIPGVVSATVYLSGTLEPHWPASHDWVREWGDPIIKVQATQSLSIDRFLLYRQHEDLANAQAEPEAKTSPTVKERIKDLQSQVDDTACRIKKAEGKDCR